MAVFFQIAGTQLVLPDYARVDLAVTSTTDVGFNGVGFEYFYRTQGDYIELPVSVFGTLVTSAALPVRGVYTLVTDENGGRIALAAAAATEPANATYDYSFNVGSPFAYGPVFNLMVIGLPVTVMLPGYTLRLGCQDLDVQDYFTNVTVTTVKIPTGPALASSTAAIASPVLA